MDEERYEINSLIGKGRTGGVYTAEDTQLRRTVAVRRFYSAGGDTSSADWEEEFLTIAQKLGSLQDPNLLTVLDAGVDEDGAFLVSQLLEGQRLSDVVVQTPFEEHEAHEMASQLLDALTHSHEAGFIHGALTAGSIMLTSRARGGYSYIIMDMGLSRLAPLIQGADSSYAMMADPALLAPELFDGEPATAVSDYYMLGHLVYLSLIGGHPFAFKSIDEVKELHKSGALPPITNYRGDLTPAFVDWIKSLTHCDISKRPQSAAEALQTLPKPPPKKSTAAVASPIATTLAVPLLRKATSPAKLQVNSAVAAANNPAAVVATAPARLTSAQVHVALPATSSVNTLGTPQAKGKKKLILAITLPLLLIVGVSIAFMSPEENGAKSFYEESSETKPAVVEPEPSNNRISKPSVPALNMLTFYSNSVSEGHSTKNRNVFDRGRLDWVVFKSPLTDWDKFSRPESDFIKKVSLIGNASYSERLVGNLTFLDIKKTQIHPNLYAQSSEIGDGWKIEVSNEQAKSVRMLKLHFTSWNCDAKLRILSADGATELTPAYEYKSDSQNTSFGTSLTFTKEQFNGHDSFLLELTTAEAKSAKPSGLSLNALILR
ncbi:MAG: serine/threonine protein kinase [Crocinitomicaceae bacterium]|jgi:serine/threonine protein kinase